MVELFARPRAPRCPANIGAIVAGNARIDDAKMTGMTPPVFTFSGMCVLEPPYIRRPDHALRVLHRDPPVAALDEDDRRDDHHHQQISRNSDAQQADLPGPQLIERLHHARAGSSTTMPAKMISDMPLPMPRSVICSPSHMMKHVPGRQRQHRHQPEAPARVVDERQPAGDLGLSLEEERDAERLHDAQHDRAVARVLRDLAPSELAFLRQPLEVGPDHRQQLQDDRRADVRHDAQREDRHLRQVPSGEHVVETEHACSCALLGELRQRLRIDPRRRDVTADPVDGEQTKREQHPLAQVGNREDVLQAFCQHTRLIRYAVTRAPRPCRPPPAIFSAALPLNLCARTVSALAMSPRASTFTGAATADETMLAQHSGVTSGRRRTAPPAYRG